MSSMTRILEPVRDWRWRITEPPLPIMAPVREAGHRRRNCTDSAGAVAGRLEEEKSISFKGAQRRRFEFTILLINTIKEAQRRRF